MFVGAGIQLFWFCIVFFFSLLSLVLLSMMMVRSSPPVWSAGALPKRRRVAHAVRDVALLPAPAPIWDSEWVGVLPTSFTADDVYHWPYASGADLGVGGGSCVELLILYELWAGERLVLEKAVLAIDGQVAQFQCRLFLLVQALKLDWWYDEGFMCSAWWVGRGFCLAVLVPTFVG